MLSKIDNLYLANALARMKIFDRIWDWSNTQEFLGV